MKLVGAGRFSISVSLLTWYLVRTILPSVSAQGDLGLVAFGMTTGMSFRVPEASGVCCLGAVVYGLAWFLVVWFRSLCSALNFRRLASSTRSMGWAAYSSAVRALYSVGAP